MAGDRARVSYDPSRKWRGVIAQQGRVTVEADWNEAATIGEERDRHVTLDVVGPVGTPDGGYAVTAVRATGEHSASTPDHLTIGKGTLYLGGERLDLDEQVHYSTQPDWLDHSTDPLWKAPGLRRREGSEARARLLAGVRAGSVGRRGPGARRRRPRRPGHHATAANPPAFRALSERIGQLRRLAEGAGGVPRRPRAAARPGVDDGRVGREAEGVVPGQSRPPRTSASPCRPAAIWAPRTR